MPQTRKLKLRHKIGLGLASAGLAIPALLPARADAAVTYAKFFTCASAQWQIVWTENSSYDTYVYDASSNFIAVGYGPTPHTWNYYSTAQPKWVLEIQRSTGNVISTKTFPSSSSGFNGAC